MKQTDPSKKTALTDEELIQATEGATGYNDPTSPMHDHCRDHETEKDCNSDADCIWRGDKDTCVAM